MDGSVNYGPKYGVRAGVGYDDDLYGVGLDIILIKKSYI